MGSWSLQHVQQLQHPEANGLTRELKGATLCIVVAIGI
jgi:hypothetical protein